MSRNLAKLFCLALGAFAGWQVRDQVSEVFTDPWWTGWVAGVVVLALLYPILYFPLVRPIADIAADRLSAARLRVRATRTGTGLDEVPIERRGEGRASIPPCAYCGGSGGPVCDSCHAKLASGTNGG